MNGYLTLKGWVIIISTTVSYNNSTIATLDNETQVLQTSGKWLTDDITITDSGGGGSTAIISDTTDTAGGTIRTITTTDEVYLQTKTITPTSSQQTVLPDTGYDGFSSVIVEASSGGSSGTWELVGIGTAYVNTDGSFNINDLTQPLFSGDGELWKVTYDNTSYECETIALNTTTYYLGNVNIPSGTDDGTGLPFFICDYAWGVEGTFRDKPQTATSKSIRLDKYVSGGSSGQTLTGTFTGDNAITVQISCSFAPDVIRIYGDLSGDVTNRGISSITIIKDDSMIVLSDTSTSGTDKNMTYVVSNNMVGYNDALNPHASYSNGALTIDMVTNTSGYRFTNGITYSYKLSQLGSGGTPSATAHTIYFEFTDSTDTTITAYYDSTVISDAIISTTPITYGQKTVALAELDGTAWYNPASVPLNTQLIDFSKVTNHYLVDPDSNGEELYSEWASVSDYTEIYSTLTYTYRGYQWYALAFYDANKMFIRGFTLIDDADSITNDIAYGTLTPSKIPPLARYIRIDSTLNPSSTSMSLIRTA